MVFLGPNLSLGVVLGDVGRVLDVELHELVGQVLREALVHLEVEQVSEGI